MAALEPPDIFFLSAAIGWSELGAPTEAEAELAQISPDHQNHPDVLDVRWVLLAQAQRWEAALTVARTLLKLAPQRVSSWLHHAYALRRAPDGGLQQAWEALLPAGEQFPGEPTVAYNLSCYACQLQQMDTARTWLQRAFKLGAKDSMKAMALADSDLQPLWEEIREF